MTSDRGAMQEEVTRSLNAALDRLHRIWQELGIKDDQRKDRMNVVVAHMCNLLDEMVNEEVRLKERILKRIHTFKEQLSVLNKELRLPEYEPPAGLTVLRLEKDLAAQCEKLKAEKDVRMKKVAELRKQDQHLCDILCATPYYIPTASVPSLEQLSELEQHIANLNKEKARRLQIFRTTKASIAKFMDDLEQTADTSFEKDALAEQEDSFLLSNSNLKTLKDLHDGLERRSNDNYALASELRAGISTLWERLGTPGDERAEFSTRFTGYKPSVITALKDETRRLERLKHENLQKVIDGARVDLEHWWAKCFTSEMERLKFKPYYEDVCSEEALDAHDREVARLKNYYEANQNMLENVAKWQDLFQQYLDFEQRASDPTRLFNHRGGNLLKEQKARAKFKNQIPRVEQEVCEQIDAWERANGRDFRVGGVRFVDYIRQQKGDHERNKENEKEQRSRARAQEMEHELMYGSKPATTPNKRRLLPGGTPNGKTPNKLRKIDEQPGSSGNEEWESDLNECVTTLTVASSPASSTASSSGQRTLTHSSLPRNTTKKTGPSPVARVGAGVKTNMGRDNRMAQPKKSAAKSNASIPPARTKRLNETPGSVSRMGRSAYNTNTMCSPVCMPPRSANKLKPEYGRRYARKTPRGGPSLAPPESATPQSRRVLAPKQHQNHPGAALPPPTPSSVSSSSGGSGHDTLFSHTTVSSTTMSKPDNLASLGPYADFAKGLNHKSKENHRSSVLPGVKPPAFF